VARVRSTHETRRPRRPVPAHAHEGHGHAHEGHAHAHEGHAHVHQEQAARWVAPEPLAEGAGRGAVLHLDCFSGIAGDMTLAALLDLGVPLAVVERALAALPVRGHRLELGRVFRSGIAATALSVRVRGRQPERRYAEIDAMLAGSALAPATKDRARAIFSRLAEAEARVHRVRVADVHFHEVGAVDAIVDVTGSAAALGHLDAEVVASPLPLGRGFVRARHGVLPLPAPAAVECLRGAPTYGVDVAHELVTPTGAAIVAASAARFAAWPSLRVRRVGYGAGSATLPDRPNLLRAVLGDRLEAETDPTHVVLETNVDDATGELCAWVIARALDAGALDAWATPVTMKKGRPGLLLAALAPRAREASVAEALLRESTTLGVRRTPVGRIELPRGVVKVHTRWGEVPVKVAGGAWPRAKPELDRCAELAQKHGVPLRVVIEEALRACWASTKT
jgi:uncharacterized protein (TIGR00299 family) protein